MYEAAHNEMVARVMGRVRVQAKKRCRARRRVCADDAARDRVEVAGRHLDGQRQRNGQLWRRLAGALEAMLWLGTQGPSLSRGEVQAA